MSISQSTLPTNIFPVQSVQDNKLHLNNWELHVKLVCEQLNEKPRRWVAGLLSEALGWGGTKQTDF
jgi:hypothetical protein